MITILVVIISNISVHTLMIDKKSNFYYPYSFDLYAFQTSQDWFERLKSVPNEEKILLYAREQLQVTFLQKIIDFVISNNLTKNTLWVLQPSHRYSDNIIKKISKYVYYIDLDLINFHLWTNETKICSVNSAWQPDNKNFLFLTGKPNKFNRIRLLNKLYKKNLLSKCTWSLFVDRHTWETSRNLLPEMSDHEFAKFVKYHNRTVDGITVQHNDQNSNHYDGYPYDQAVYANASFRLISETARVRQPIITEKTRITIGNNLPFIMAGYKNNLQYLKKTGYRTFENYLPLPHYDSIEDDEERINCVVKNVEFWCENIHSQQKLILNDITHNRNLQVQHIKQNLSTAKKLLCEINHALKCPLKYVYQLFPFSLGQEKWVNFYYNIKDPSWPDCLLEELFGTLPSEIQQECVNVFGYRPDKKQ